MRWWSAIECLRSERRAGVLVTVVSVRGHTPREGGAKMVVSAEESWGTIGGGNLEATAIDRAHAMMVSSTLSPELLTLQLSDKADARFGVQCCGGEVTLLLDPLPVIDSIALFGFGHVGLELGRILSRLDVNLHLIDSRAKMLTRQRLAALGEGSAVIQVHHAPVPESVIEILPEGTLAVIMTHDHAEDMALCDMALRSERLSWIGLIGSQGKWVRFQRRLREEGHPEHALARIHTPIGVSGISSKSPAAIAVSAAAELLQQLELRRSAARVQLEECTEEQPYQRSGVGSTADIAEAQVTELNGTEAHATEARATEARARHARAAIPSAPNPSSRDAVPGNLTSIDADVQ